MNMMMVNNRRFIRSFFSSSAAALGWLGCIVLLWSIEFVALLAMVYALVPYKLDPIVYKMFPLFLDQIRPEREMRFFIVFILFNCFVQAALVLILRNKLGDRRWQRGLRALVALELLWVVALGFAAFKFFLFGYPSWARILLWIILAGAVVSKVFFPELCKLIRYGLGWLKQQHHLIVAQRVGDCVVVLGILGIIFIPDLQSALGRIYQWDQFFHIDMFVMSAAWAKASGAVLNMDVISLYSVVLPTVFSKLMSWMGAVSYENLLTLMMWATIGYYVGCYFVLRNWLKSFVLACVGIILIIHMQMFQVGIWPIIWRYPSVTPLRHLLDIAVFYLILRHAHSNRRFFLWAASIVCGIMTAYMIDVGIQLILGFYAYLFILCFFPSGRKEWFSSSKDIVDVICLGFLPWLMAGVALWMFQGSSIFSSRFWGGIFEYVSIFLSGWGSLPITDALKDKQFFAVILGLLIPAVYVWTMLVVSALLWFNRVSRLHLFIVFICVYGLASFHYYLGRSASTSYSAVIVPFIFVVCYWFKRVDGWMRLRFLIPARFILLLTSLAALMSNFLLTNYPNILNLSGYNWRAEKEFYSTQFNVNKDAQLIQSLIPISKETPLISSFETKFLMEAKRKPFFYYFPLVESVLLTENRFRGTSIYTRPRMARTLEKFEKEKPEFVFVETKVLNRQISAEFYERFETLRILLDYVHMHYDVYSQGQYLTALKRKPIS